jgi:hypothetical protein
MPEIWLRYGTTDVVLDIRFENLASQVSSSFALMSEEQARAAYETVPATDNMLLVALSPSRAAARAVNAIAGSARAKGLNITVDVPARFAGSVRSNLASLSPDAPVSINRIDYQSLEERAKKFQGTVFVSQVAYDPLFGFAGAPTTLIRELYPEKMAEAFSARRGNIPAPGEEGEPLKVAAGVTEGMQATAVELVANSAGVAGVHVDPVNEAFAKATSQLKSMSTVDSEPVRSAIISASGDSAFHSTLAGSLNSLWNSVHAVKEGGTAVLLAENREGIGGGALQSFVEGRLRQEQVALSPYVEGLEHLLYLQELKQRYELGLVSSLPYYYAAAKLGFTTYSGVRDALEKLLAKHGKGHKALVVSDADITLLRMA